MHVLKIQFHSSEKTLRQMITSPQQGMATRYICKLRKSNSDRIRLLCFAYSGIKTPFWKTNIGKIQKIERTKVMRMEMRAKETRERIIIDTQLGYPLVFIDYYGYDRCYEPFFAQAKREILNKIGSGDGPVDWDKETDTVKEALVIGRWIEKGYLCYPAAEYLSSENYGCGPKHVDNIYEIIRGFDGLRAIRWRNSCKSRRMEVSDFLHKAQKAGKLPQKDEQEERPSKDEQGERPAIVVTKELGYPMVFVEYAERGNCSNYFFARVKETMFTNPFTPSKEVYKKNQAAIDAETRLIADWLDKGYLCYPANGISLLDDKNRTCGPRYVVDTRTIVRRTNGVVGTAFYGFCWNIYEDVLHSLCLNCSRDVEMAKPAEESVSGAIEGLDNPKLFCKDGQVYYQAYPAGRAYNQVFNFWIRKSGLSDDEIYTLVGRPLASDLVLLTLPPEMKKYEDMYWTIIGSVIAPGDMRDIVDTQAALSKILGE